MMVDGDRKAAVPVTAADVDRQRSAKRRVWQQALADYAPVIMFATWLATIRAAHTGWKDSHR